MKQLQFLLLIALNLLLVQHGVGQNFIVQQGDTINRLDEKGQRQGQWNFFDSKTLTKVAIRIKDDVPVDSILFYRNEKLQFIYIKSKTDTSTYIIHDGTTNCRGSFTLKNILFCQTDSASKKKIKDYILFEIFPSYYGGESAMYDYIKKRTLDAPKNEKGRVKVSFVLDKTGSPTDIKIIDSENSKLNAYSVQIIKEMPRWQPGYQGGAIVNVPLVLPLKFN
jgi:TonB family protein